MFTVPWWILPLVPIALTQVATLATSVYLHRGLTHHSLELHPAVGVFFRTVLWLTTGQRRREWVAVHRKHHAFTDRDGDPHSPRMLGFWRVQLFNVYYYAREARNRDTIERFAPDLPEDAADRFLFSWGLGGLGVGISLLCLILGFWPGVIVGLTHAVLYVFVVAPLINGLGHWRGQQNFPNTAFNSRILAWFTIGESLHNNHHANLKSPKFSVAPGEFDPSWPVITFLRRLRLLKITGPVTDAARE